MKKTIITLLFILLAVTEASSQSNENDSLLYQLGVFLVGEDKIDKELLEHKSVKYYVGIYDILTKKRI